MRLLPSLPSRKAPPALFWLLILAAPAGLAAALETPEGARAEAPEIRSIVVSGVGEDRRGALLAFLHLRPGSRLESPTEALATRLATYHQIRGFPAAQARVRYEAVTGTLFLDVDLGRLASVTVQGLSAGEEPRVLRALGLRAGTVFQDDEITDALFRADDVFPGALETIGEPPYSWERLEEGVALTLHFRRKETRAELGRGGTGRASLFNRVDGWSLGLRGRLFLYEPSLEPLEAYAHVSYGVAAQAARFATGVRRSLGDRPRLTLGYEFHDLTDTDDTFRGWGIEKPAGRRVFFSIFEDYYRRRGHEASAFLRVSPRLHFGLDWRSDRYSSLPLEADGSFLFDKAPPPNPPVREGLMRSLIAVARWSTGAPLFADREAQNDSFLVRNPYGTAFVKDQGFRAEASFEWADAGTLGGDFSYRRLILHLRGSRHVSPRQALTSRFLLGWGDGDLPPQRRFALGGMGTLRGRALTELVGDRVALATAEYAFEPGSPYPGLVLFYDGGSAWSRGLAGPGWLSDVGAGVTWPGGQTPLARIDVALPVNTNEGAARRARITGYLMIPFL